MNLKALRCCVEIVRQGSFTKAAQHLHIAQPALSMAVTRLEEELGVTLFNRTTRKVILTAEGEQFLPRIASALREMDVARQELRDMADLKRGEVRLGIPPMFGLHYVPVDERLPPAVSRHCHDRIRRQCRGHWPSSGATGNRPGTAGVQASAARQGIDSAGQ